MTTVSFLSLILAEEEREKKKACKIKSKSALIPVFIFLHLTTMSFFEKNRKYTEVHSNTERFRGYAEDKVKYKTS